MNDQIRLAKSILEANGYVISKKITEESTSEVSIQSIPWTEYLDTDVTKDRKMSKEISDIWYGKSEAFSSSTIKDYAVKAVEEYIDSHESGLEDDSYRDSFYSEDDERVFVERGKKVLELVKNIPIQGR